jgi:hypothetical protein
MIKRWRRTAARQEMTMTSETPTPVAEEPTRGTGPERAKCDHCRGTGYELTTNDLIRESLALFPTDPVDLDEFVREFYRRLVKAGGPGIAGLFPGDLVTADHTALDSKGKAQRDRLLAGILTAIGEYDPASPDRMDGRETHLGAYGRSHRSFVRPFGGSQGATMREYVVVGDVLMGLIHDAFGSRWRPEYDAAWAEAYEDTAVAMLAAARAANAEGRSAIGRLPRRAGDESLRR